MGTSKLNVADMTDILHPVLAFSSTAYSSYFAISPITVQGDYLFAGGNGLFVFNLSNPIAPVLASSVVRTPLTDNTIFARDDTVIVTYAKNDGSNYIDIFNVSDKSQPSLIKEIVNTSGYIQKMVVNNNIAYFSTGPANGKGMGIEALDFSDPANSSITDQIFLSDIYSGLEYQNFRNLLIKDNKLYALSDENIYVLDISNHLANLGLMNTGLQGSNNSISFNGEYLYLFGSYFNDTTFNIFDLTPEKVSIDKSTTAYGPVKSGDLVEYDIVINNPTDKVVTNAKLLDPIPAGVTYIPDSATVNGEPVTDVSDGDAFSISNSRPTWNFGTLAQSGQENSHYAVSFKVKVN
jgi:uncharacterized repeat protein (TIGR01451 family)